MDFIRDTPLLHWIADSPRCLHSWSWSDVEYPPLPYGVPWFMIRADENIDDWCFCRGVSQSETFYMVKIRNEKPDCSHPIVRVTGARKDENSVYVHKLSITWAERKTGPIAIEAYGLTIGGEISFQNITLWWDTSFGHIQRDFDKTKYPDVNPFSNEYLRNPIDQIELRSMESVSEIARKFS